MVIGSLVGAAMAVVAQGVGIGDMMNYMNYGYVSETGIESVDSLLSRGGLQEIMWTISLGFSGLSLGGLLEKTRMLEVLLEKMGKLVSNSRGLITTQVLASLATNLFSASRYIAIIIPGRMLVPAYRKLKIPLSVCSRTCEDSATVTSPLVPWGLGGAYYMGVLDVSAWDDMGWTFLALITPVIAVIYAMFNLFIWRGRAQRRQHLSPAGSPARLIDSRRQSAHNGVTSYSMATLPYRSRKGIHSVVVGLRS